MEDYFRRWHTKSVRIILFLITTTDWFIPKKTISCMTVDILFHYLLNQAPSIHLKSFHLPIKA